MHNYSLGDILYEIDLESLKVKTFIVHRIIIQAPPKDEEIFRSGVIYTSTDGHSMYQELLFPTEEIASAALKALKEEKTNETKEN